MATLQIIVPGLCLMLMVLAHTQAATLLKDYPLTGKEEEQAEGSLERNLRHAVSDLRYRWTGGVIPYDFLRGHFNSSEEAGVKEAMQLWQDETCLTFRPATSADKNKVTFRDGNSCYSMLGMIGGRQYVTLSRNAGCRKMGLFLHEIGHAIGLVHEHQLPSRDQYIRVHMGNVFGGAQTEFKKLKADEVNTYGVPYDLTSIMHYGKQAMSGGSDWKTMEAVDNSKNYMIVPVADKFKMSFSDIKVVNLMYNCSAHCAADSSCASPGFLDKNCKCVQPEYVEYCKNLDGKCESWKKNDQCQKAKTFMEKTCPISCGLCKPKNGLTPDVFPTEAPKKIICVNKNSMCDDWAGRDQCNINKLYMEDECPLACGLCEPKGTKEEPKPKQKACVNDYGNEKCEDWAKKNECKANPDFMKKQCAKACGVCEAKDSDTDMQGDQPAADCTDDSGQCAGWAKMHYCRTNAYTKKHCRKTCGLC